MLGPDGSGVSADETRGSSRACDSESLSCIPSRIRTGVSKSIRVDEDTHAALEALKRDDETFDELLSRLVRERRETVREGAGLWEGTDAADTAREKRREMKRGVGGQ